MTIGLDGFQYGLHVLMERATITKDLCIEQFAKLMSNLVSAPTGSSQRQSMVYRRGRLS